jgi:hypothetical protein
VPLLDLGLGGRDAGRNALAWNANPSDDLVRFGVNLVNQAAAVRSIQALGNQWEHCGLEAACNVPAVRSLDMRPRAAAATIADTQGGHRGGPPPVVTRVVPARPRAGDFVRVYNGSLDSLGGTFNAVDGMACTDPGAAGDGQPAGLPADPCSPESPRVVEQNRAIGAGNTVTLSLGGETLDADVHAVTPTMLIFRMPVDCFAPGTLVVTRGNDAPSAPVTLCDPGACADRPAGEPCDDGDVCTVDERCDGNGACVPSASLPCTGTCLTGRCDPLRGCIVAPTDPACDDGNACTSDRCTAAATCRSTPEPDGSPCPAADVCHGAASCRAGACDGGPLLECTDGDFCTEDGCDPAAGCVYAPVAGVRRSSCRVEEARAVLASLSRGGTVRRQLDRQLARAGEALERMERATRPRGARAAGQKARVELRAFVAALRANRRRLGQAVEKQLIRSAKAAITNLKQLGA